MTWSDVLAEDDFSFGALGVNDYYSAWFPTVGIGLLALSSDAFGSSNIQFYVEESPDASTVKDTSGPLNDPWIDANEDPRPYGDGFKRTYVPGMRYARLHVTSGTGTGGVFYSLRGIPY